VEASVLKDARRACHQVCCACSHAERSLAERVRAIAKPAPRHGQQARDIFYKCVETSGADFTPENPTPSQCKAQRKAYERACKASWVSRRRRGHQPASSA
jgi:hypothetical protein